MQEFVQSHLVSTLNPMTEDSKASECRAGAGGEQLIRMSSLRLVAFASRRSAR